MTDENRTLKDAFYGGNFRVGKGLLTRDKSTDSNDLTEATFENIQTWDELTDQTATDEAFDELTDSEQAMDDSTESNVAFDVVTDKEPAMDKVTDKEMPMDKVTDKEIAMDKVTDKEMPMDKVTDKEMPMDKVTDKEVAMDKVTDKEVAMDKVTDKEMPMDKVVSKSQATRIFLTSPHLLITHYDKTMSSEKLWNKGEPEIPANLSGDGDFTMSAEFETTFNGDGLAINLDWDSSNDDDELGYTLPIDLTDISNLKVVTEIDIDNDFTAEARIKIDGDVVFSTGSPSSPTTRNFDVSSYTGVVDIEFTIFDGGTDNGFYKFGEIKLNE